MPEMCNMVCYENHAAMLEKTQTSTPRRGGENGGQLLSNCNIMYMMICEGEDRGRTEMIGENCTVQCVSRVEMSKKCMYLR